MYYIMVLGNKRTKPGLPVANYLGPASTAPRHWPLLRQTGGVWSFTLLRCHRENTAAVEWLCNVDKTITNRPSFEYVDGLYTLFMVKLGMASYCFTNIT